MSSRYRRAGFIGSHLAEALASRGYHGIIVHDLSTGSFNFITREGARLAVGCHDNRYVVYPAILVSQENQTLTGSLSVPCLKHDALYFIISHHLPETVGARSRELSVRIGYTSVTKAKSRRPISFPRSLYLLMLLEEMGAVIYTAITVVPFWARVYVLNASAPPSWLRCEMTTIHDC